jgi:hypothetical protein
LPMPTAWNIMGRMIPAATSKAPIVSLRKFIANASQGLIECYEFPLA